MNFRQYLNFTGTHTWNNRSHLRHLSPLLLLLILDKLYNLPKFYHLGFLILSLPPTGFVLFSLEKYCWVKFKLKLFHLGISSNTWVAMASMGSLPFVVDKGCSILVCHRKNSLPFLSLSANKSFCFGGCNGFLKCSKIKATGKEFGEVGEDGDAIQAAINKSQKLLAVQKDLIQQVVICI